MFQIMWTCFYLREVEIKTRPTPLNVFPLQKWKNFEIFIKNWNIYVEKLFHLDLYASLQSHFNNWIFIQRGETLIKYFVYICARFLLQAMFLIHKRFILELNCADDILQWRYGFLFDQNLVSCASFYFCPWSN